MLRRRIPPSGEPNDFELARARSWSDYFDARGCLGCGDSFFEPTWGMAEHTELVDDGARVLAHQWLQVVDGYEVILLKRVRAAAEPLVGAREVEAGGPQRGIESFRIGGSAR